jgi:hypothetical protein
MVDFQFSEGKVENFPVKKTTGTDEINTFSLGNRQILQ